MKESTNHYFQEAKSWSDDIYIEILASRNRYRLALLWSFSVILLCLLAFIFMLPLQHTKLIVIHHADDGTVWAEETKHSKININQAQIESDIVRYIVNRESYSPLAYQFHYKLINLLSNNKVAKQYQNEQSILNPNSPINRFQQKTTRHVQVQGILFIEQNPHKPLAEVNFTVTDYNSTTEKQRKHTFISLISWQYERPPLDPSSRWLNWDGFTVTHYSIQQHHLEKETR